MKWAIIIMGSIVGYLIFANQYPHHTYPELHDIVLPLFAIPSFVILGLLFASLKSKRIAKLMRERHEKNDELGDAN